MISLKRIEDYYNNKDDTNLFSTGLRPMNERVKICDENEVKKILFNYLKDLINFIGSDQFIIGLEDQFEFEGKTPIEEEKRPKTFSKISNLIHQ